MCYFVFSIQRENLLLVIKPRGQVRTGVEGIRTKHGRSTVCYGRLYQAGFFYHGMEQN